MSQGSDRQLLELCLGLVLSDMDFIFDRSAAKTTRTCVHRTKTGIPRVRSRLLRIGFTAAMTVCASGQPRVDAVVNAASYGPPGMPNYGVAQGSIATAFGSGFPNAGQYSGALPIPSVWQGVSVTISMNGTSLPGYPIQLATTQVSFVVPSHVPLGDGQVIVTVDGVESAPAPIRILPNNFGAFSWDASGSGPGVIDDVAFNRLTLERPTRSGAVVTVWGTGLGANQGDPSLPSSGNLDVPLEVYVAGRMARVLYKGRAPCCVGLDQINFEIPEGAAGCLAPVLIKAGQVVSNLVTVPIVSDGGQECRMPGGVSLDKVSAGRTTGTIRTALIGLERYKTFESSVEPPSAILDSAYASFRAIASSAFEDKLLTFVTEPGTCHITTYAPSINPFDTPRVVAGLSAGSTINIRGRHGVRSALASLSETGVYRSWLGVQQGTNLVFTNVGNVGPPFLSADIYTVDNGAGGSDVQGFQVIADFPAPLEDTDLRSVRSLRRNEPLTVRWTGFESPYTLNVSAEVHVPGSPSDLIARFSCSEKTDTGIMHVPALILQAMPASNSFFLWSSLNRSVPFSAPGLDVGVLVTTAITFSPWADEEVE